jgi:hypothetical protein
MIVFMIIHKKLRKQTNEQTIMIIFMIIHKKLCKHTNETRDYDNLYDNSQATCILQTILNTRLQL